MAGRPMNITTTQSVVRLEVESTEGFHLLVVCPDFCVVGGAGIVGGLQPIEGIVGIGGDACRVRLSEDVADPVSAVVRVRDQRILAKSESRFPGVGLMRERSIPVRPPVARMPQENVARCSRARAT